MRNVRKYYNNHVEEEDHRLIDQVFELPVTFKYINQYLEPGDKVLDIACGTGRYAGNLLKRGYQVAVNDLSDKNMELALKRIGRHPNFLGYTIEDARSAVIWKEEKWDAVLMLGTMYHLRSGFERSKLLSKARRHVKDGGYLFLAFMNRTLALVYGLKHNPQGILHEGGARDLWKNGSDNAFIEGTPSFTNAYFSFPEEIEPMVSNAGWTSLHLAGIEGIFGERMELYHRMDRSLQRYWLKFLLDHGEDPHMVHTSKHLLSVCRKETSA